MRIFNIGIAIAIAMCAWTAPPPARAQSGKPAQHTPAATPSPPAKQSGHADKNVAETIRGYTVERRDAAVATARRATDDMDRQMERLQTQMSEGWARMSTASRERSEKAMADLRSRRNMLAEWVGGMKHGSADAWSEVKGGFARSYDELALALRKARSEFELGRQEKPPPSKPAAAHPDDREGG
jgi:hypothetical protein